MNITLKDVPKPLHAHLQNKAKSNGRSLSKEILATLQEDEYGWMIPEEDLLSQIRAVRKSLPLKLTLSKIESAIQERRR